MADAVTTQVLYDDGGHAVLHFTNVSDGTGEADVVKVNAATLVGGGATTRYAVEAIAWACVGMGIKLLWEASADVLFFTTGTTTSIGFMDYINGSGGRIGSGPGKTGLINNAGSGVTGSIGLTTAGQVAGSSYVVTLWLRKTAK